MLKRTTLILCLFALLGPAHAQQDRPEAAFPRYKWELGTDLLFLVNRNTVPPSVFVRLNSNHFTAWRFRVGGSYAANTSTPPGWIHLPSSTGLTGIKTRMDAFLGVGREWQRDLGRFQLFYGSDIAFRLFSQRDKQGVFDQGKRFLPFRRETSVGLSPFIGMKYFIHPQVSVSAESHLDFYYRLLKLDSFAGNANGEISFSTDRWAYLLADFRPLYVFHLSYHF